MIRGQIAIVTGAGRGIGRAIARRLAAAGAAVVVAARNEDELDDTQRIIGRAGGRCLAVRADVSTEEGVERLFEEAVTAFERVDVLVNNAGSAPMASLDAMEPRAFDALVEINIRAVFLCCRAAWQRMAPSGGGTIVNISSVAATDPFPGLAAYGGTKAFVNTFSQALDREGAPLGIRVFCVAPGAVETQMLRGIFPDFPADKTLSADDVAAFVESLLLPAARPSAGQVLTIRKS
ncbi:MAG: SDR family oxidoreductase [Phycisphaerae bacterium]